MPAISNEDELAAKIKKEELEKWRTLPEWLRWFRAINDDMAASSKSTKDNFRVDRPRKVAGDAIPIKEFREMGYAFEKFAGEILLAKDGISARLLVGSEKLRDIELKGLDSDQEKIQRIEITSAVGDADQGKVEKERMTILGKAGKVPARGNPQAKPQFFSSEQIVIETASRIEFAINNKLAKIDKYLGGDLDQKLTDRHGIWLIVGFNDEEHLLTDMAQHVCHTFHTRITRNEGFYPFSHVWLVNCLSGRDNCRMIYGSNEISTRYALFGAVQRNIH